MKNNLRFFGERASDWEEVHYPADVRQRLEALIREFGVRNSEVVLDVGTGPGILIPYLRKKVGPSGRILAVDLSLEMLRQAKRKPLGAMDIIVQADVHSLPFSSERIDRVICFAAFPHFKDKPQALQEMSRVLIPGGQLIIAHLLSRKELAMHHAAYPSVACDVLPDDRSMRCMFRDAGLLLLGLVDRPGRYLAKGKKKGE